MAAAERSRATHSSRDGGLADLAPQVPCVELWSVRTSLFSKDRSRTEAAITVMAAASALDSQLAQASGAADRELAKSSYVRTCFSVWTLVFLGPFFGKVASMRFKYTYSHNNTRFPKVYTHGFNEKHTY